MLVTCLNPVLQEDAAIVVPKIFHTKLSGSVGLAKLVFV